MNKIIFLAIALMLSSCSAEAATTFRWDNPPAIAGATFVSTNIYCDVDNAGVVLVASVSHPTAFIEYVNTTLPTTGSHNISCQLKLQGFDNFDPVQTLLESPASTIISFNVVNGNLPTVLLFAPTNFRLTR